MSFSVTKGRSRAAIGFWSEDTLCNFEGGIDEVDHGLCGGPDA